MKLIILSPQKQIADVPEVSAVELPSVQGRFVVLNGHAPVIALLTEGVVRYDIEHQGLEERHEVTIKGGFVEVKDDVITVCAD